MIGLFSGVRKMTVEEAAPWEMSIKAHINNELDEYNEMMVEALDNLFHDVAVLTNKGLDSLAA